MRYAEYEELIQLEQQGLKYEALAQHMRRLSTMPIDQQVHCHRILSMVAFREGQFEEALQHALAWHEILIDLEHLDRQHVVVRQLVRIYTMLNQWANVVLYAQKYQKLKEHSYYDSWSLYVPELSLLVAHALSEQGFHQQATSKLKDIPEDTLVYMHHSVFSPSKVLMQSAN